MPFDTLVRIGWGVGGRRPCLDLVDDIHKEGGTVLGTSRGPVDTGLAVDNLIRRGVNILFTIGGDGEKEPLPLITVPAQ